MCGIAGIIGTDIDALGGADRTIRAMTDALGHRGPDGRGVWIDRQRQVALGHRRLSILDLSDAAAQPMADVSGRLCLVFNGEIYNYRELRQVLNDYPFRTGSDTEVILAAYQRWGEDCVGRFNGMFAFALWDEDRKRLFCARDRLGVKPFHYARSGTQLLFGSEVKALLAGGHPPAPDMRSWARYLTYGAYEDGNASFFAGVAALPPGHTLSIEPGGELRLTDYWRFAERLVNIRTAAVPEIDPTAACEQLVTLLESAVAFRLRSDVPVALNLTGGLDSSSVAQAFFRQTGGTNTHVFTACFDDPRYDEDGFADRVPGFEASQRHRSRLVAADVPTLARRAMLAQEAPFGGIATLAYHQLHEDIRAHGIKVVLEGQGGDELFGGYAYFQPERLLDRLDEDGWRGARAFARTLPNGLQAVALARRLLAGTGAIYQDGTEFLTPDCIAAPLRNAAAPPDYRRPCGRRFDDALYRDLTATKLPRVLRMNDRLSMASGVELRQPFLDVRMVEFAAALPASLKIADGWGKHILRRAMDHKLPPEIVWTRKRPVVTPQREWLAGPLADWVGDIVHSRRFIDLGWFDPVPVRQTLEALRAGTMTNTFSVWQWICADLWCEAFLTTHL